MPTPFLIPSALSLRSLNQMCYEDQALPLSPRDHAHLRPLNLPVGQKSCLFTLVLDMYPPSLRPLPSFTHGCHERSFRFLLGIFGAGHYCD